MNLPRARRDDLLTTNLEDEVVVYDPKSKRAHSLNRLAVAVWNHSDGGNTIEEVQRLASKELGAPIDQADVWLALRKLERAHLLMEKVRGAGPLTRREMLGKAGRYGAAAMATPLIASALVPVAVAAQSACTTGADVCFGQTICATVNNTNCFCDQTAAGGTACTGAYICNTSKACTTDADCGGGGFVCEHNCCDAFFGGSASCGPPCGQGISPTPVGHGLASNGITY